MVLEKQIIPFFDWIITYLPLFLLLLLLLAVFASLVGFLVGTARMGPGAALKSVRAFVGQALVDLRNLSFGRIFAMARLAVKESLRSYVLVVFGVLALIFLFAGWYLDSSSDNPARLYISFVLKATNFLVILLTIFLSAFSLPNDVKNRTIYTVVTKPVRGLSHTHTVDVESYRPAESGEGYVGRTSFDKEHRHEFTIGADGEGVTESVHGHYHFVTATGDVSDPDSIEIGTYGVLRFLSRKGEPASKGINVGKEWTYRGYIEGRTLGAGIWKFNGLRGGDFLEGLPLEMSIRVFRTFQGDIDRGILGSMELRNPNPALLSGDPAKIAELPRDTAVKSRPISFTAQDTVPESRTIPREIECQLVDGSLRKVDVFEELVHNGELEVLVRCDEGAQYFGMAKTDLYLRASDRPFFGNFMKAFLTIWLQMLIVASLGVMFSTFLTGSVAMMATIFTLVIGFFADSIIAIATGEAKGGGPIEAAIRIVQQQNMTADLGSGVSLSIVHVFDLVTMFLMRVMTFLTPNFRDFAEFGGINTTRFVAYGFDIPAGLMWQHVLTTLAYVVIATLFGYIFLKSREVAA